MNVSDVSHGPIETIDLRHTGESLAKDLAPKSEAFLYIDEVGEFRIKVGEQILAVDGAEARDRDALRRIATRGLPRLVWVVQARPPSIHDVGRKKHARILIQVCEFPASLTWDTPMEIGVDDRLLEDLRKRLRQSVSIGCAVEWFTDRMLLPPRQPDGKQRALLSGPSTPSPSVTTAFRLHGAGFAVDIQREPDDRLQATRVVIERRRTQGTEGRPIYLVTCPIHFCDATVAGKFRGVAQTELDRLVARANSYLELWNEYNTRERETVLQRAREFGSVFYARTRKLANGDYYFEVNASQYKADDVRQKLDAIDGERLKAGEEAPSFSEGTESEEPSTRHSKLFTGDWVRTTDTLPSLTLRPPPSHNGVKPPNRGYIFLDLSGHEASIKRRKDAWNLIRDCANPMPQLGLLIEGQSVPERQGRRLKGVTKAVREVFPKPNERQVLALEVALNTPDIALIQGPPGTGKTSVVSALQARLAESDEFLNPVGLAGTTLLTSFQHDAVEHAASATMVMGLPAVKVGYRRGSAEARDGVDIWAARVAGLVRATRGRTAADDSVHDALRRIRELALSYLQTPSRRDNPDTVLRRMAETARRWLPAVLIDDLERLKAELAVPRSIRLADEDRQFALRAVRALRTQPAAYSDDGPANAFKALRRLERLEEVDTQELGGCALLTSDVRSCLERAIDADPNTTVDAGLLRDLELVRNALIDRLRPTDAVATPPRVNADVESMISRTIDALTERASKTPRGADDAIDQWLNELENNPSEIRRTVMQYSMVLAATCQQSVGSAMQDAKGRADNVFRTVIVDEAPRSNPLDLLIPMARAERRIVLVGDHRQLPHVLDQDVEREIERSIQEVTRSALRKSLFEKLFIELRQRERRDGVPRTVTLNTQYRMHPLLGEFLSAQFYEPHGEGFESGQSEDRFEHGVTLSDGTALCGKVAAWIDVPFERGEVRWSDVFRQLVGEFKVDSATTLNYRPQ